MAASGAFPHRALQAGDILIREGDQADAAYYVLSGSYAVTKRVGEVEVHLATIEKEMIVGEMSMIDGNPRSATVRCVESGVVVVIGRKPFEEKLEKLDTLTRILLQTLSDRLRSRTEDCIRAMAPSREEADGHNLGRLAPDGAPPAGNGLPSEALKALMDAWHRANPADRTEFWRAVWACMTAEGVDVLLPSGRRGRYTTTVVV